MLSLGSSGCRQTVNADHLPPEGPRLRLWQYTLQRSHSFVDLIYIVTPLGRPFYILYHVQKLIGNSPSVASLPYIQHAVSPKQTLSLRLNTALRNTPLQRLLANKSEPSNQHKRRERAQNNSQRNKSTDNTTDRRRHIAATVSTLLSSSSAIVLDKRSARTSSVTTLSAPLLSSSDSKLIQLILESSPRDSFLAAAEEREDSGFTGVASRAVVEQETDLEVISVGESRVNICVGEKLKGHGASVIDNAGEVVADFLQVRETEEGHEGRVGAELDAEFLGAGGADDVVHVFEDFSCELHAGDCAHVVAGVVGEAPLMGVGESAELGEGGVG